MTYVNKTYTLTACLTGNRSTLSAEAFSDLNQKEVALHSIPMKCHSGCFDRIHDIRRKSVHCIQYHTGRTKDTGIIAKLSQNDLCLFAGREAIRIVGSTDRIDQRLTGF